MGAAADVEQDLFARRAQALRPQHLAAVRPQADQAQLGVPFRQREEVAADGKRRAQEVGFRQLAVGRFHAARRPRLRPGGQVECPELVVIDRLLERAEVAFLAILVHHDLVGVRRQGQVVHGVDPAAVAAERAQHRVVVEGGAHALVLGLEPVFQLHLLAGVADDAVEAQRQRRPPDLLAGLGVQRVDAEVAAVDDLVADRDRHRGRQDHGVGGVGFQGQFEPVLAGGLLDGGDVEQRFEVGEVAATCRHGRGRGGRRGCPRNRPWPPAGGRSRRGAARR